MALGVYGRGEPHWWRNAPASIAAPRCATPSPAAQRGPDRRRRPNALASVGFVPGAKARSAPQSRGLASLVRVTWCSACSPHGSAGSTGCAEAVVGITCPKPAGRRCWVATAGDCTSMRQLSSVSRASGGESESAVSHALKLLHRRLQGIDDLQPVGDSREDQRAVEMGDPSQVDSPAVGSFQR